MKDNVFCHKHSNDFSENYYKTHAPNGASIYAWAEHHPEFNGVSPTSVTVLKRWLLREANSNQHENHS